MVAVRSVGCTSGHQESDEVVSIAYETDRVSLYQGDCRIVLRDLPDGSVDSVVCDPPYELGFMGKGWDRSGIAYDVFVWSECLRVLKPGGHLLAFGGSRTYHRLACAIEDAGFEIRDQIQWIYGSGFPKSLNVGRSIDSELCSSVGRHFWSESALPKGDKSLDGDHVCPVTAEGLDHDGQGTALKPAHEPIVLARKPLIGTVAQNILEHGTGGLNIDGCRIGARGERPLNRNASIGYGGSEAQGAVIDGGLGRWPANVIHDGSDEVLAGFPETTSGSKDATQNGWGSNGIYGQGKPHRKACDGDTGSAAR